MSDSSAPSSNKFQPQTIRDYWIVFRENIWYFVLVFALVASACGLYYLKAQPTYHGTAYVHLLRNDPSVLGIKGIETMDIQNAQDFNTQIQIMESGRIVSAVIDKLKGPNLQAFIEPYKDKNKLLGETSVANIIVDNRIISPVRSSLMVQISYFHPDPDIAALVANLIAKEYVAYKVHLDVENSMTAVNDLKLRVEQQRKRIGDIEAAMNVYREQHGAVSLETAADIDHLELTAMSQAVALAQIEYDDARLKHDLVQQFKSENKDIAELPFISKVDTVNALSLSVSKSRIEREAMKERYGPRHPKMIEANLAVDEAENELRQAVANAGAKIRSNFENQEQNYNTALTRLKDTESKIINLGNVRVEYSALQRDLNVNKELYETLVLRMNTELAQINLSKPNARIIDQASAATEPHSPKLVLVLAVAVLGGGFLGFAGVFFAAYFDDKVKSAFDVEERIKLPLIGIIPKLKKSSKEKLLSILVKDEPRLQEAFRSIHSSMKITECTREGKVILVTSTVAGEGKTSTSLNLAATLAQHGDKTLLIDADLRLPSLRHFSKQDPQAPSGVIQLCAQECSFSEATQESDQANLHFISSGGRSTASTHVLSSRAFSRLVTEAREHYDKIIIDTPPVGVVSDVLNILNLADALIYIVKYNSTSTQSVLRHTKRIAATGLPIAGLVMNQVPRSSSEYYYDDYYSEGYVEKLPKVG